MNCSDWRSRLDAYIDGELTGEDARAFLDHARGCPECARELEIAENLRDALKQMDEGVAVPLEAQAAWRGAVRAEAKKRRLLRWRRAAYAAAAALVLVIGGSLALRGEPDSAQPLTLTAQETGGELIASDGDAHPTAEVSQAQPAYSAWKKILTDAPEEALQTLEDLAAEYSGSCTSEGEGVCRIELPSQYLEDFLNAASRIGTDLDSETGIETAETAVVYIQLSTE